MANVIFNRKTFEKDIGKIDDKMQNQIALFGTTLEKLDDKEIEIEIFPNRPDLLSYQGYKRGFLAFLGRKGSTGLKEYKIKKPLNDYKVIIDSSVKTIRPYTACAIIKNIKLDNDKIKELIDIQEKLHLTIGRKRKKLAIGIYPLEKITLPIKYEALEPDKIKFRPLESEKEMTGLQILQRHPTGRDYAHLLAGKEKFPIFIDSNNNILSMPPIINSHLTGKVSESTKDVFIECSGFDLEVLKKCLNILITTISDFGEKENSIEIFQMELEYKSDKKKIITPNLTPEKMKLNISNANKLLGLNLNEAQVKTNLEKMGYNYNIKNHEVTIPSWRTDILHEVDLIEDIAIGYGYNNFNPLIPEVSSTGKEDKNESTKRKISQILSGLNMLEVSNFYLTKKEDQYKKMNIPEKNSKFIEVINSKTEYNILRQNLSHYLLKNLSENVDSEYPQRIYETGVIFNEESNNIYESDSLAIAITPGNFTELKQIIDYLGNMLNLKLELKEPNENAIINNQHLIEGRIAEIYHEGKPIGFLGEVHPKILRLWKLKMPAALLEINLESLYEKLD